LIQNGLVTQQEIEKGPATMDFHRDFYNESEIELDSGILYDLQIAMQNYPDKIIIMQQKGKAVEVKSIITDSKTKL
jgi:ABC-type hemin transport system ATPase subunit